MRPFAKAFLKKSFNFLLCKLIKIFFLHEELKKRKKLAINGAVVVVNSAENVENINENDIIIQLIGFSIEKEYINILKQSIIEYCQKDSGGIKQKEDLLKIPLYLSQHIFCLLLFPAFL